MKAFVDKDVCVACGACIGTCPDVFSMSDEGHSVAIEGEIPEDLQDLCKEAEEGCPVSAITVK
ncbi:ferredoxin [Clostridioides difficile]|uniref:Ferredoxin n=1 Tax=Clostridioides difficile TaxID=1496 RepID=A0A6N3AJW0_CLODI|nr:ferredoxin [Clostridioides difficile]AQU08081.1 ferredoxin [Clostridioides difficile]ASN91217.1 ferredoxin [Clostridioides difficile]AUA27292.1 ferredoxin [Clostridioides difficile]EAA0003767.1 ferredoxin [Clostridioides difficile]EGT3671811.1 ferredoxin [Clostridioides difficile]